MAAAELESTIRIIQGEIVLPLWVDPDTCPTKARFEALDTHDREQKPRETNDKRNMHEQGCSFFETSENYLGSSVSRIHSRHSSVRQELTEVPLVIASSRKIRRALSI
jgi:hypothetical protein